MHAAGERDVPPTQNPATDPAPARPRAARFLLFEMFSEYGL